MEGPTELLEKQKELLINKLSEMFIHGTEPYVKHGGIEYRWKRLNESEDYNNGILMLELINKQIDENRRSYADAMKPEPPPEPVKRNNGSWTMADRLLGREKSY